MNIRKKFVTFFLIAISLMTFVFSSCAGNSVSDDSSSSSSSGEKTDNDAEIEKTDIVLAEDGKSDYKIVVPAELTESVEFASQQLQKYLEESTGAVLPIVNDAGMSFDKSKKVISLGKTAVFNGCGLTVDDEELNRDGFKIQRFGNAVVICGARDIGTTYGVYEFLTYEINFEAFAADAIEYDNFDKLTLCDFALKSVPDFRGRTTDGSIATDHMSAVLLRIRTMESREAKYDYGGSKDCIPNHSETFYQLLSAGTYNDPAKPDTYHPEWWPTGSLQFCLTNEEAIKEFIKNSIDYVDRYPDAEYFHISECDGAGWCQCETCKAEQSAYGISGYKIRFTNKIIEAIEEHLKETDPDRKLKYVMLGYGSGTIVPPVESATETDADGKEYTKYTLIDPSCMPHEKLYIQLTPIDYCYSHAFDDPKCTYNVTLYDYIKGWTSITDRFCVYDYGVNYDHYFRYFNNFAAFQRDLQIYKEIGVEYIFRQNSTGGNVKSFGALYNYLFGKLTWDVDQDVEALIEKFMNHYYKSAAPQMKEFFNTLRMHFAALDAERVDELGRYEVHFRIYWTYSRELESSDVWTKSLVTKLLKLSEEAAEMADDNLILSRVQKESLCPIYLQIKFYKDYYEYDKEDYLAKITAMEDLTTQLGVTYWKERKDVSTLYADWRANA